MILADTNVIIDFWKSPTERMRNIFIEEDVAICGIVKAELIHGARSSNEIDRIVSALDDFYFLEIDNSDWIYIGRLLNRLKTLGVTVPFQDAVLAYLSIKNKAPIWTLDKHFGKISEVMSELKIYSF